MITKFKSNVKSKKWYAEANMMSAGWGNYLKSIDELKDAVAKKVDITLNDACWVLYGEGHCSWTWEKFKKYCISKRWKNKRMPWEAWNGLFSDWIKQQ